MGYKNKKYRKDLIQQINDRFKKMLDNGIGRSKLQDKANGNDSDKIYSYNTYESYYKHAKYFARYIRENHPECTNIKQAKRYINEWLQSRVDFTKPNGEHLSAWTITLEREALGKLYGMKPDDPDFFRAPERKRENIIRSRGDAVRDKHFSSHNNDEFIKFCQGTGCRRNIMEKLEGRDLISCDDLNRMIDDIGLAIKLDALEYAEFCDLLATKLSSYINNPITEERIVELRDKSRITTQDFKQLSTLIEAIGNFPDCENFIHHRSDKGGRERYAPIIGNNADKIVERMRATAPDEKVWKHVPGNADIHSYRAEYATYLYNMYARPIDEISCDATNAGTGREYRSGVYYCRKDEYGKKLDKEAMFKCSKALGHNRLDVVANNYLRGI